MKITTNHPASSHGIPVILDDYGQPMDLSHGIIAFMAVTQTSAKCLANKCGVSIRTVEGWRQGRQPKANALNVMKSILEGKEASK